MGLIQRIALIDATGHILDAELTRVAAAIDLQVQRDLSRFWPISGSVMALPSSAALRPGTWPVFIVAETDDDSAGFHRSLHNQPYAEVADGPNWSIAASHEILEMLADPSGNRLVAANAIGMDDDGAVRDVAGSFEYLLEICDPCEDPGCAYLIGDVLVSDFCTPDFFNPQHFPGTRYSFTGAVTKPRRVCQGGYLSWWDPEHRVMRRLDHVTDPYAQIVTTGRHMPDFSLREFVDRELRGAVRLSHRPAAHPALQEHRSRREAASRHNVSLFRQQPRPSRP